MGSVVRVNLRRSLEMLVTAGERSGPAHGGNKPGARHHDRPRHDARSNERRHLIRADLLTNYASDESAATIRLTDYSTPCVPIRVPSLSRKPFAKSNIPGF
jgi:hypothetical protein